MAALSTMHGAFAMHAMHDTDAMEYELGAMSQSFRRFGSHLGVFGYPVIWT